MAWMNRFRIDQFLELLDEPEVQEKVRAILSDSPTENTPSLPDGRKGFGDTRAENQTPDVPVMNSRDNPVESSTEREWEEMYHQLQEEHQKLMTRNARLEQELTQALRQSKTRLTEIGKLKGELAQSHELMEIREGQMVDLSGMLEEAQATLLVYGSRLMGELASEQEEKRES